MWTVSRPLPLLLDFCNPNDDSLSSPHLTVADILLVGADAALLEGIAQALAAAGHHVLTAASIAEASFAAAAAAPLLAVVDRALLATMHDARALGLAPGGALVAFGDPAVPLPGPVRRAVLAELRLPLERARLSALAAHVEARAHGTGRDAATPTPSESRPAV
jgi:DNA-binding NarL/FixJ family response regulator